MLTVTLLLSGPHRAAMADTAFSSIPIESPAISEVVIRHQGGPFNWGGELRERMLSHPKVRLVEFPDKAEWTESFNRTLDLVQTPWALLLPDDDFLVRDVAKENFEFVSRRPDLADCGLIAFGWYYLKNGVYVGNRYAPPKLASILTSTPKFCSTLFNMERVRGSGGFREVGGFVDLELYGRLMCEYDAAIVPARVGVYRMHAGQDSLRIKTVYEPFVNQLSTSLSRYARTESERRDFERALHDFVWPRERPVYERLRKLAFQLRGRSAPPEHQRRSKLYRWSEG